jgi:multidrug efflux pump subunit AcrA (membrane-fusion protein)
VAGIVEAVTVKVGDVVQATQIVGKLVPQDRRFQVVAFLPEKDRSSVKLGDEVRLELEQFPYAEFGTIRGHIKRIGDDLASSAEMREALGEDARLSGSAYRVEIAISDPAAIESGGINLRSGMLMNVRYTLRRERPITFFFAPIRRWLS